MQTLSQRNAKQAAIEAREHAYELALQAVTVTKGALKILEAQPEQLEAQLAWAKRLAEVARHIDPSMTVLVGDAAGHSEQDARHATMRYEMLAQRTALEVANGIQSQCKARLHEVTEDVLKLRAKLRIEEAHLKQFTE
jgi:hypothetical protein